MAEGTPSAENVIAVSFEADANAYQALTALKELDTQQRVHIRGAGVVVRGEDGRVEVKDEVTDQSLSSTARGGIFGLLIGILAGPLGVLIGGTTGVLIGSLFDVQDADETQSVLAEIAGSVRAGHTALLADVVEQSPEVVDSAMTSLGGSVLRRPVEDVEAEIAAAENAARAAAREAHKELRAARHERNRAEIRAKLDELKAKLRPHRGEAQK
jgi:uncharacterized membrane protein